MSDSTLGTGNDALKALTREVLKRGARRGKDGRYRVADGAGVERSLPDNLATLLEDRGLISALPDGRLEPTEAAANVLRALDGPRQRDMRLETATDAPLLHHDGESPIARLARTRDEDGAPFLDRSEIAAADRLRRDFELGQMMPRLGVDLTQEVRGGGAERDAFEDVAMAARQRLARARDAVGPDFADLLTDACCLLLGITELQARHRLPQRSGKVVLRLGLRSLARHYGLRS
jgi:hypothetical protein